jgi:hypothetical protein
MNVVICRTFLRAVLLLVIGRGRWVIDRSYKYRPLIDCTNVVFCRYFPSIYLPRSMRAILCEFFPDGLYCWVKCASAYILLPGQCPYTCPATTFTPTGVSA